MAPSPGYSGLERNRVPDDDQLTLVVRDEGEPYGGVQPGVAGARETGQDPAVVYLETTFDGQVIEAPAPGLTLGRTAPSVSVASS